MTQEQRDILSAYEDNLRTAYLGKWCRMIQSRDLRIIADVYMDITGNRRPNLSCSACVLEMMEYLGRMYFKGKENGRKSK